MIELKGTPTRFVFYTDSWSHSLMKPYAEKLSPYLSTQLFTADLLPTGMLEEAISIYDSNVLTDNFNLEELAKYDLSMLTCGDVGLYNSLYGNDKFDISPKDRVRAYLNYIVKKYVDYYTADLSYLSTCLVLPSPLTASRRICYYLNRRYGCPTISMNASPFPGFIALDNGQPIQTGTLSNVDVWNQIKELRFSNNEKQYYKEWRENFIRFKDSRGPDSTCYVKEDIPDLPDDYYFVVGQSPNDANQIIHSRCIEYDPITLILHIKNVHTPCCIKPIVFKKHPEDESDTAERLRNSYGVVVIENNVNIHHLIANAAGVYTWNSNVGVEALVYHKPVTVLAEAFYRNKGITCDVDYYTCLEASRYFRPDEKMIDQFLTFLLCRYLVPTDSMERIAVRMQNLIEKPSYFGL